MAKSAPDRVALSVIIPFSSDPENLELLLPALNETLGGLGVQSEIVVVSDESADKTAAPVNACARVIWPRKQGYAAALVEGIRESRGQYLVTMDADLSHRPAFLLDLWKHRDEAELIIASRYVAGGECHTDWFRRFMSRMLNITYTRLLSLPLHDISSGFRLYRRDTLDGLVLRAQDFDILEEILIKIYTQGFRILELPFRYRTRGSGRALARMVRFGWAYLKTLVRMWQLRNSVASTDYDHRAFDSPIPLQRYWQRERYRIVMGYLESCHIRRPAAILDIGCGSSRIIQDLSQAIGLDISFPKLRFLRARHDRLIQGSVFALPFASESFDAVICSEVLEHVSDDPTVFPELTRILRPGGTLILGTPDYGRLLWWVIEWIYGKVLPGAYAHEHITHPTRASITAQLHTLGYTIRELRYVGFCEMIFKATKPTGRIEASPAPPDVARVCYSPTNRANPATTSVPHSSRERRS